MHYTWLVKANIINRSYIEVTDAAYLNRIKKKALPFYRTNAVNLKTNYYCLRIELPAMVKDPVWLRFCH
jgi:hypothetical protein